MNRNTTRSAFTLIELLVVIAIVALLITILLPALTSARRAGYTTVSASNLKQLANGIAAYGNENKDSLVNPFDAKMRTLYTGRAWCNIITRRTINNPGGGVTYWAFDDAGYASEMFAFHWASLLMDYVAPGQLRSRVQFAPGDRTVLDRFNSYSSTNLENTIWDGSYVYSPTMWLAHERYQGTGLPPLSATTTSERYWRRNRFDHVVLPWGKVMLWERFDFFQLTRRTSNGPRTRSFPQWNNSEAKPRFARVDGSVDTISIAQLNNLVSDPDPAVRQVYTPPGGLWRMPTNVLGRYSMDKDGLENGQIPGTIAYPAFFWSTFDGIRGRDIVR